MAQFGGGGNTAPGQPQVLQAKQLPPSVSTPVFSPAGIRLSNLSPEAADLINTKGKCIVDSQGLQWYVYDTQAQGPASGVAETNIRVIAPKPFDTIIAWVGGGGGGSGPIYIHFDPMSNDVSGGTLTFQGGEQIFHLGTGSSGIQPPPQCDALKFCVPITQFYWSHSDFGNAAIVTILLTSDVSKFGYL